MPGIFNFPYLKLDSILSINEQEYALDTIHSYQQPKTNLLLYVKSGQLLLNSSIKYTLNPNELLIVPTDKQVNFSATVPNTIIFDIVFQTSSEHLPILLNNAFYLPNNKLIQEISDESNVISNLRRRKPEMSYDMEVGEYFTASCASLYTNVTSLLLSLNKREIENHLPDAIKSSHSSSHTMTKKDSVQNQLIYAKKTSGLLYKKLLVSQIITYMKTNLDCRLSITQISQEFLVGSSNLKKIFKSETNLSIMTYFKKLKMEQAKEWIKRDQMTYTAISIKLGFNSVNHFSNSFKKYAGVSPSQYYKNQKKF